MDRPRLLQEDYIDTPHGAWKVLVICQCLNRAQWTTVEPILEKLFKKYPEPKSVNLVPLTFVRGCEVIDSLYELFRPLGFGLRRASNFLDMSASFLEAERAFGSNFKLYPVMSFKGCGQYASDAWGLFVLKEERSPRDKQLKRYAERLWTK